MTLAALWLPILVSAVVVFVGSAILHMVLRYHDNDFVKLPNEEAILDALRDNGVQPGAYVFPRPDSRADMGKPETLERYQRGPVGTMQVLPNGPPMMPKHFLLWFLFCLLVSTVSAYLASWTLGAGAATADVFRFTATAALLGYCFGDLSNSIWKGQSWGTTAKNVVDGLLYALLTAGVFGWLWPS